MKLNDLLDLQYINKELPLLTESEVITIIEALNCIDGCGNAVTKEAPLQNLEKYISDATINAKLQRHSAIDAKSKGIEGPKNIRAHFLKCTDGIKKTIETLKQKKMREDLLKQKEEMIARRNAKKNETK